MSRKKYAGPLPETVRGRVERIDVDAPTRTSSGGRVAGCEQRALDEAVQRRALGATKQQLGTITPVLPLHR